jgi:hypothetical protein
MGCCLLKKASFDVPWNRLVVMLNFWGVVLAVGPTTMLIPAGSDVVGEDLEVDEELEEELEEEPELDEDVEPDPDVELPVDCEV